MLKITDARGEKGRKKKEKGRERKMKKLLEDYKLLLHSSLSIDHFSQLFDI